MRVLNQLRYINHVGIYISIQIWEVYYRKNEIILFVVFIRNKIIIVVYTTMGTGSMLYSE